MPGSKGGGQTFILTEQGFFEKLRESCRTAPWINPNRIYLNRRRQPIRSRFIPWLAPAKMNLSVENLRSKFENWRGNGGNVRCTYPSSFPLYSLP